MTTPEQLKRLAEVVEPDREWQIIDSHKMVNGEIIIGEMVVRKADLSELLIPYQPNKSCNDLVPVIFALAKKCKTIHQVTKLHYLLEMEDRAGIIDLAIEVLCND